MSLSFPPGRSHDWWYWVWAGGAGSLFPLCHQTPCSSQVPGERRSASLPQSLRPSPFLCTSFTVQGLEGYPDKRPIQLLPRDIHIPSLLTDNTFSKETPMPCGSDLWGGQDPRLLPRPAESSGSCTLTTHTAQGAFFHLSLSLLSDSSPRVCVASPALTPWRPWPGGLSLGLRGEGSRTESGGFQLDKEQGRPHCLSPKEPNLVQLSFFLLYSFSIMFRYMFYIYCGSFLY